MTLDLTVTTSALAEAAADLTRLLPARLLDPVLAGVVVRAEGDAVELSGTDRDRSVLFSQPARVHTDGRALVPARALADTLRHLDEPEVRLVTEGSALAIRTSRARFALATLDLDSHPGIRELPDRVDALDTAALRRAAVAATAASNDDALPVFTGVHLRQRTETCTFVGTDRFRMAVVTVPREAEAPAASEVDVLIPASLLTEFARHADGTIGLHVDANRVGLSRAGCAVSTTVLDAPFPDESRYLTAPSDCRIDVDSGPLHDAARRIAPYADGGVVEIEVGEAELRLRAGSPRVGEAEETVRAAVDGERLTVSFAPRYLLDAVRAFAGRDLRLHLRNEVRRAAVFSDVDDAGPRLDYVVMPKAR